MYYEQYKNILPSNKCEEVYNNLIEEPGWAYSGTSDSYSTSRFLYKELIYNPFYSQLMVKRIFEVTGRSFEILRIYANGQVHGQSGNLHQDDCDKDAYTFLYYANPTWNITWGGSTVFYINDHEFDSVLYIPNSAILFKGNILHAGLEPTIHCNQMRVTVAFKMKVVT